MELNVESLVISWRELLFAAIVVLAVYAAEVLLLLRARRGRRQIEPFSEHVLADLRQEIDGLRGELTGLHREVAEFKKKQSEQPAATPYSQAIQLARDGREVADLTASCGISRGEAELIVALYRAHS